MGLQACPKKDYMKTHELGSKDNRVGYSEFCLPLLGKDKAAHNNNACRISQY